MFSTTKQRRTMSGLALATAVAALAAPSGAHAATQFVVAQAGPTPGNAARAILEIHVRRGGSVTQGVVTGLQPGSRYSVSATARSCSQVRRKPAGLLGTMYGGSAEPTGMATFLTARRSISRRFVVKARAFLVVVAGTVRACGDIRRVAASSRVRFKSFRIHPIEGHEARGIVQLTRTSKSRWRVSGLIAGLPAGARYRVGLSRKPSPSLRELGWEHILLDVVNSEGWDEVPPELMFAVKANGAVRGAASADLSSVRSLFTILTDAGNEIIVLGLSAELDFDAMT